MTEPVVAGPVAASIGGDQRGDRQAGVLIVDDSLVVRRLLQRVIGNDPGLRVVGEADDGQRALTLARSLRPDLIVLDLEMPSMDGFAVLDQMRAEQLAIPVIVFANVDAEDLDRIGRRVRATGAALVVKPVGVADATEALTRIKACLLEPLHRQIRRLHRAPSVAHRLVNAVVIASSTGGPHALEVILGHISELRVPVFIVQHIADGFSGRLAGRLDTLSSFPVDEVVDGERPEPGRVYIGPGGTHLCVERDGDGPVMRLRMRPPVNSCRPSADVLFQSSAEVYGGNQLGVVLTGIGRDGFDGCQALSERGATILVQDEATSVVWGMPGVVAEGGLADEVLPIDDIGARIQHLTGTGSSVPPAAGWKR